MFKGIIFSIFIIFSTTANAAKDIDFGVSSTDIKHLKKAIRYVEQKKYDSAIYETSKTKDDDIVDLVLWMMYQKGYEGSGYEELNAFIERHSSWPRLKVISNKAEFSLTSDIEPSKIIKYFKDDAPVTGHGMFILAKAKIKLKHGEREINKLLRQAWVQGDFSRDIENSFISNHSKRLRHKDHVARIDRLLWEHKVSDAKRVMRYVNSEYKTLFTARIYLITRRRGVDNLIQRVSSNLKSDPGLLYERIQWHMKRKNYNMAHAYILQANKTMPYQKKWWAIKNRIIRELIEERKYSEAYILASNHGNEEGTAEFAESGWLSGWLAYLLSKKDTAYEHFYSMYKNVNFPVSKARAAYWAGRSSEETGNKDIADKWYKLASSHPTTFYGQMAHLKVHPNKHLDIKTDFSDAYKYRLKYEKNMLVKMAYLLIKAEETSAAKRFIKAAIDENNSIDEMNFISRLGIAVNEIEFSVIAAKQALKKHVVLTNTGWPVLQTSQQIYAEKPFVMAIARQESLFDTEAKSGAGARGLMQLMPATARHVSKKLNIGYNKYNLTAKPKYNLQLGGYYINHLVNKFDGSYVLAIASYNAGPSNVKKWLGRYGDPRRALNSEQVINWIEHIPFKETRNYVQRVLENVQVYRHIMHKQTVILESDLLRYNTKLSSN